MQKSACSLYVAIKEIATIHSETSNGMNYS